MSNLYKLNIHERIKCFFELFGCTNSATDEDMAKELKVHSHIFQELYNELEHCVKRNKIPNKKILILINKIWKKYNNNPKNFGIYNKKLGELYFKSMNAYKKLKNEL